MNRTLALAALALGLCSCDSSIFFAEVDEPTLCKQVDGIGPFPAAASAPPTVSNDFEIPVGDAIPVFDANLGTVDMHVLGITLTAGTGMTDFNGFDAASLTLIPPDGSGLSSQVLVSYTKGATPPGAALELAGDPAVNIFPYLQTGGNLAVHAELTGTYPATEWSVNIKPCLGMKVRVNHANLFLTDGGL